MFHLFKSFQQDWMGNHITIHVHLTQKIHTSSKLAHIYRRHVEALLTFLSRSLALKQLHPHSRCTLNFFRAQLITLRHYEK